MASRDGYASCSCLQSVSSASVLVSVVFGIVFATPATLNFFMSVIAFAQEGNYHLVDNVFIACPNIFVALIKLQCVVLLERSKLLAVTSRRLSRCHQRRQ